MNVSDLIIIYLACGAPFAVYFYLQNRRRLFLRQLIIQTVLNFIFWIPFSLRFLYTIVYTPKNRTFQSDFEPPVFENLEQIQKRLEKTASNAAQSINFYEFRETLNRYIGLSLSILNEKRTAGVCEQEIFRFSEFENAEIGSICLERRNRRRLLFHQRLAGNDFAEAVFSLKNQTKSPVELEKLSVELTQILNDLITKEMLQDFFIQRMQISSVSNVKNAEKTIWNSPQPKLPNREQILIASPTMNRTNLRLRD